MFRSPRKVDEVSSNELKAKLGEFQKLFATSRREQDKVADRNRIFEEKLFEILHNTTTYDPEFKSLFHHLNYQRVVNKQSIALKWWTFGILAFAAFVGGSLYIYATFSEELIPRANVLSNYEALISSVDFEINYEKDGHAIYPYYMDEKKMLVDSTLVELAITNVRPRKAANTEVLASLTESFFSSYYLKYFIIRIFIAIILISLVSASIRVYFRLRRDRMSLIYREEATTTLLHLFEKYVVSDHEFTEADETGFENSRSVLSEEDKNRVTSLLPSIISHLYHNPDDKGNHKTDSTLMHEMLATMQKLFLTMVEKSSEVAQAKKGS